jgi:uncharacterized protein (DUF2336 family)
MIVHRFLAWVQSAPPAARAAGTAALARVFLESDLDAAERADAEAALMLALDDPDDGVRAALADALRMSADAPRAIVVALAADKPEIACKVLGSSPLVSEAELIHHLATGGPEVQAAIAQRFELAAPVAAALAEVGEKPALLALARNVSVAIPSFALARMVERHGDEAALREALLQRPDLSLSVRQALAAKLTRQLHEGHALPSMIGRGDDLPGEAAERATLTLAATASEEDLAELARHLRQSGQLTARLLLRAMVLGHMDLAAALVAELSGIDRRRASGLLSGSRGAGFAAVYRKAGLPARLERVFVEVVDAHREILKRDGFTMGPRLARDVAARVLEHCAVLSQPGFETLGMMLRRIEAEAAREDARQRHQARAVEDWSKAMVRAALGHDSTARDSGVLDTRVEVTLTDKSEAA